MHGSLAPPGPEVVLADHSNPVREAARWRRVCVRATNCARAMSATVACVWPMSRARIEPTTRKWQLSRVVEDPLVGSARLSSAAQQLRSDRPIFGRRSRRSRVDFSVRRVNQDRLLRVPVNRSNQLDASCCAQRSEDEETPARSAETMQSSARTTD